MDTTSSFFNESKTKSYAIPEVRWDAERNEPYCEVKIKGQRYLMTMWRESDGDGMVRLWNHPAVGKWSVRRPYPYTHAHLQTTWDKYLAPDRLAIPAYRAMIDDPSSQRPKEYILKALRTPEGKMIGSCTLSSYINANSKPGMGTGFGEVGWEITYDLDPEYWGRGIGKWIVGFLMSWAGWAGISSINARVASGNMASQGVLKANGFEKIWTEMQSLPEEKGGQEVEYCGWSRKL